MTTPKSRPIMMKAAMVQAYFAGRKSVTRRVRGLKKINENPDWWYLDSSDGEVFTFFNGATHDKAVIKCPFGVPGDSLWFKETWRAGAEYNNLTPSQVPETAMIEYLADREAYPKHGITRPSMFMPKWASRVEVPILSITPERLQNITEQSAMDEGVDWEDYAGLANYTAKKLFATLWDSINGKKPGYAWDNNPWVWPIGFPRYGT